MTNSILLALAGGALIGVATASMMFFVGRIAGISGIVGGTWIAAKNELSWRAVFILGLLAGGAILMAVSPGVFQLASGRSMAVIGGAGILVGIGTQMGSGCTSGHGICGISRGSSRSLVATLSFVAAGVLAATFAGQFGVGL